MRLTWLGHASFRLDCGVVVYFDPYGVVGSGDADLILVSHSHYDHCDVESIRSLSGDCTYILCPNSCVDMLDGNVSGLNAGDSVRVGGVKVEAYPAYNVDKPNHPVGVGVGFVVEACGRRVYHAGDTDLIPEMYGLGVVDVALLPVGGTYTMDASEAADAVYKIKPKVAVPMHYGGVVGSVGDALLFADKVKASGLDVEAVVLGRGEGFDF